MAQVIPASYIFHHLGLTTIYILNTARTTCLSLSSPLFRGSFNYNAVIMSDFIEAKNEEIAYVK